MSLLRGNALSIPLADNTVDLIVTSPPYFALRSYTDACGTCGGIAGGDRPVGGPSQLEGRTQRASDPGHVEVEPDPDCPECEGSGRGHYAGQLGSEATPAAFIDALIGVTRECVRVLKPSGSMFVNLGDKYAGSTGGGGASMASTLGGGKSTLRAAGGGVPDASGMRVKSLMGLPWRYALRCIDDLGLILRAEIIWSKPNGLPESVQDRVRRSHEQWFHFTLEPRYYSAVDEIREAQTGHNGADARATTDSHTDGHRSMARRPDLFNPLGKLPGSVWTVPTEPLRVPDDLPQHFAAFPSEWPRRIILGWSPSGICVECGEGRRPVSETELVGGSPFAGRDYRRLANGPNGGPERPNPGGSNSVTITGESCACPTPTAPTRPAVVLDPFCGTGTTPAVANALGRYGVGLDLSADYLRLARWRCNDPGLRAKALGVDKPAPEVPGQMALL